METPGAEATARRLKKENCVVYTASNPHWWARITSYSKKIGAPANILELGKGTSANDIVSFSYSKSITGTGSLNLVLVPGRFNYFDLILPNSPVEFWVDGGEGEGPALFVAYVNRISLTRSAGGGGVEDQRILISCSDVTRVLNEVQIFYSGYNRGIELLLKNVGLINAVMNNKKASLSQGNKKVPTRTIMHPSEFLYFYLTAFMGGLGTDDVGDGKKRKGIPNISMILPAESGLPNVVETVDWSSFVYAPPFGWPFCRITRLQNAGTNVNSLWQLLTRYSHPLFNEMFIDTRPSYELTQYQRRSSVEKDSRGFKLSPYAKSVKQFVESEDAATSFISQLNRPVSSPLGNTFDFTNVTPYFANNNSEWAQRLVFRPRPYLSADLRQLYRYYIHASEVTNFDLGFSMSNVYNYFRISPTFLGKKMDMIAFDKQLMGILNMDSATRLGLKRFEPTSDFMFSLPPKAFLGSRGSIIGTMIKSGALPLVAKYQSVLLSLMHYRNDELLNGSMTFPSVRPNLRVGNALEFDTGIHTKGLDSARKGGYGMENILFYIETVTHSATADSDSNTSVGLVRGRPIGDQEDHTEDFSTQQLVSKSGDSNDTPGRLQFVKLGQNVTKK